MNRNRHLSTKTYGPRHTQPHMHHDYATKKKTKSVLKQAWANSSKKKEGA